MSTTLTEGDRLQLRMQRIRNRMHAKVDVLREDAQQLFDWHYYFNRFPWAALGGTALIAFWLAPGHRVTPTVRLSENSIDELIRKGGIQLPPPRSAKKSWTGMLLGMASNMAIDMAMGYASQMLQQASGAPADPARTGGRR